MKRIGILTTLFLAFVAAACWTVACQSDTNDSSIDVIDGAGDFGSFIQPIYGGSPPDAPEHAAVVGLHQLVTRRGTTSVYTKPFCSGTLITDSVVLTAAHCLDVSKGGATFKTMAPKDLAIYVGDDPSVDLVSHLYFVSETVIYPSYNRIALRNDLALVRLASSISEPVTPVGNLPAAVGFTGADVGSTINFAGFGEIEDGSWGVKYQADGLLGSLGCTITGCPDAGDAATQIAYAQDTTGPCFGDSGGPAFVYRGTDVYVGGITSYGDSKCTVYGMSTRVDAFESFINDFANPAPPPDCSADSFCNPDCAAGADPDCTVEPPASCGDGNCGTGESCDGRSGTVSCPQDCPGRTGGKPSGRYCYVEGVCEGPGC